MAWDDAPPTAQELKPQPWDATPPTKDELAPVPEPGGLLSSLGSTAASVGKTALGAAVATGRFIDRYTGAPVRATIGAAQEGKDDPIAYGINQFGEDPDKAPSAKQIVMRAGVDDKHHLSDVLPAAYMDRNKDTSFWDPRVQKGGMFDPSAADVAGLAMSVGSDPMTYVGPGLLRKAGGVLKDSGLADKVANAAEIEQAAQKLGVKPTQGMLSDSYAVRGTENSLSQSPTFAGSLVRGQTNPVHEAINSVPANLLKDASALSPAESGSLIKKGLISNIGEKYSPIQMAYDDIADQTKNIPINAKSAGRVAKNIRNLDEAVALPDSSGAKIAKDYASSLENLKNADQIKTLKSQASAALGDPNVAYTDKQLYGKIRDKLDRFQSNSIMRNAIEVGRNSKEGSEVGSDLVQTLKEAGQKYQALKGEVNTLSSKTGISKPKYGISTFMRHLDEEVPEQIPNSLFQTGDSEFLNFVKDKYPNEFNLAREQKLAEIQKRSTTPNGKLDFGKFQNAIKNYTPEAKTLLLGDDASGIVQDARTLKNAVPAKVGASDTPRGFAFQEMLNPLTNVNDLARYGFLKAAPYIPAAGQRIQNTGLLSPPVVRGLIDQREQQQQPMDQPGLLPQVQKKKEPDRKAMNQ